MGQPLRCTASLKCNPPSAHCCLSWCCVVGTILVAAAFMTLFAGMALERTAVQRAADTTAFYQGAELCAENSPGVVTTFANRSDLRQRGGEGSVMVHCGACGNCSSRADRAIYNATRLTLTDTATRCALRVIFGGEDAVATCFDDEALSRPLVAAAPTRAPPQLVDSGADRLASRSAAGTAGSRTCSATSGAASSRWAPRASCPNACSHGSARALKKHVLRRCLWSLLRGERNNADSGGVAAALNACLRCDEKLCGPAFVRCAGQPRSPRPCPALSCIGAALSTCT
jgi:hypothetical protein